MVDEKILFIITSELTGQASDEDLDFLKDWLQESKEHEILYHNYKEAFLNGTQTPVARDSEKAFKAISGRLGFEVEDSGIVKPRNASVKHLKRFHQLRRIAAIFIVLVTVSFVAYRLIESPQDDSSKKVASELVVKSNPSGIKSTIKLPDGSTVILNSESFLEYSADFSKERVVKLVGEAFFDVKKDTGKPFIVKAGCLNVRVLGTSFNVNAFPFEQTLKVALVSGRVAIENSDELKNPFVSYLKPDEMLTFDLQSNKTVVSAFDYNINIAWKAGELNFKDVSFSRVVKLIERWYGVEITVTPSKTMTGTYTGFYINEPLVNVLEGLAFSYDFDFEIHENKIIIK